MEINMEPLISVIVPIYNIESYIERCIQSLLRQTYNNLEIILIDDGSTDKSGAICDALSIKNDKVNVIHKVNGGSSDARNAGIKVAKGTIISFVDGDDEIDEQMYEKLIVNMDENSADIAMCRIKRIEDGREFVTREFVNEQSSALLTGTEAMELLFLDKIDCSVCVKIFKKELFQDIKFPIGKTNEDFAVLYRLFHRCKKISYIKDALYNYYCREGSVTKTSFNEKQFDKIDNCREMCIYVNDNVPRLKSVANYYFVLQTMYLLKTMILENIKGYEDHYILLRKIIKFNTKYILRTKYMNFKEKLMCLCLGWFPKIYKMKHMR